MADSEELAALKRKLAARRGKPGYAESNRELAARIAEMEAAQ